MYGKRDGGDLQTRAQEDGPRPLSRCGKNRIEIGRGDRNSRQPEAVERRDFAEGSSAGGVVWAGLAKRRPRGVAGREIYADQGLKKLPVITSEERGRRRKKKEFP